MAKLLLLSTVLMSVWWPIVVAKQNNPRRGLKLLVRAMIAFNIFYVFAVLEIFPRMPH